MSKVPAKVLSEIRTHAEETWGADKEMVQYTVDSETDGYLAVAELDFGRAIDAKERILAWAEEFSDLWEDRASFVSEEVEAYNELLIIPDEVPANLVDGMRLKAAAQYDWFSVQLEEVAKGIAHFRYVRDTRAKIEPIRDLLSRLESIVGAECYNNNIQNYSSWGVWEGEGRSFRYPITFLKDGNDLKRWGRADDLQAEELVTGHYRFGANELSVYRALVKIIDLLEAEYGLNVRGVMARDADGSKAG